MSNKDIRIPVETRQPNSTAGSSPYAGVFERFTRFCQSRSLFLLHYCTGCGAIELPPAVTSRFDMERLGIQPMATPRQADILLVTGYVATKTLKRILLTYEQMNSPKYVIGICSCTVNGGMYWQSYATVKKLNDYIPVDLYIAGCMPRPEAVVQGMQELMDKISAGKATAWQDYYRRYDHYLGNQQALFGKHWQTPTDVIAEARHYDLFGPDTLGDNTALLEQYQQPLEYARTPVFGKDTEDSGT